MHYQTADQDNAFFKAIHPDAKEDDTDSSIEIERSYKDQRIQKIRIVDNVTKEEAFRRSSSGKLK